MHHHDSQRIVLFGANGRVGKKLVAELLHNGYSVRAVVHGEYSLTAHPLLEVVSGDIYDKDFLEKTLDNCTIVMSTLGSWGTQRKDVLSVAMSNIIPIMQCKGINRIISLTGADSNVAGDKHSVIHFATRLLFLILATKIMRDSEIHNDLVVNSGLEWQILRSPIMNDRGDASSYKIVTKRPFPWNTINRMSVAKAMASIVDDHNYPSVSPFIVRV